MFKALNKKRLLICAIGIVVFVAAAVGLTLLTPAKPYSDINEEIAIYTRNKPFVKLSVSVVSLDESDITVYGHDGRVIKNQDTKYELGQMTQIFTGAIAARSILNGDIMLNQNIGTILPLPGYSYNPTILELVTNTSAYSSLVPDGLLSGLKRYYGFSDFDILMSMSDFTVDTNPPYIYSPSDFGAAVLGTVLGDLYNQSQYTVLNDFIHLDLGLRNTFVGVSSDRVSKGYYWKINDSYISSLGLCSTIEDMSSYIRMHLTGDIDYFNAATTPVKEINEDQNVGFFWNISKKDNIVSYSGQTEHYASAVLMDKTDGVAVIVLSNYANDKYGSVDTIARSVMEDLHGQF